MRTFRSLVAWWAAAAALLAALAAAGCGGSYGAAGGTTAVTVTVGASASGPARGAAAGAAARPLSGAIPDTVTLIRFTVSGEGMDNAVSEFPIADHAVPLTVTLQIPSGPRRTILVEAFTETAGAPGGLVPRYRGRAVIDATGIPLSVTIAMEIDPRNPALATWTNVASSPGYGDFHGAAFGNGTFVAVGDTGALYVSTGNGATWESVYTMIFDDFQDVAFGNGVFAAVYGRYDRTEWISGVATAFADNTSAWTTHEPGITTQGDPLKAIAFGDGAFVCVGDNAVWRSLDNGVTWTGATVAGITGLSGIAYGNGRFVAVSAGDNAAIVSTDRGATWTLHAGAPQVVGVAFGNGVFLAVDGYGDVWTSADGADWTQAGTLQDLPSYDETPTGVTFAAGLFVALTDARIAWSADLGATWAGDRGNAGYNDAAYGNGRFVAVGPDLLIDRSDPF